MSAMIMKLIEAIYGAAGRKLVEVLLKHPEGATDEEVAQEADMKINDVRRLLYEMAHHGLVSYIRSTKGDSYWYSYRWYTSEHNLRQSITRRVTEVLRVLEERLVFESSNTFYICPVDLSRYTFEEALENNFQCIRCGADLVEYDNSREKQKLKELIEVIRKDVLGRRS